MSVRRDRDDGVSRAAHKVHADEEYCFRTEDNRSKANAVECSMDNIEYREAQTILCATDFCPAAVAATGRAAQIAQASHGKLELMHVIPLHKTPVYRNFGWQNDRDEFAAEAM